MVVVVRGKDFFVRLVPGAALLNFVLDPLATSFQWFRGVGNVFFTNVPLRIRRLTTKYSTVPIAKPIAWSVTSSL